MFIFSTVQSNGAIQYQLIVHVSNALNQPGTGYKVQMGLRGTYIGDDSINSTIEYDTEDSNLFTAYISLPITNILPEDVDWKVVYGSVASFLAQSEERGDLLFHSLDKIVYFKPIDPIALIKHVDQSIVQICNQQPPKLD